MSAKQDKAYPRSAVDLERKYNFEKRFQELKTLLEKVQGYDEKFLTTLLVAELIRASRIESPDGTGAVVDLANGTVTASVQTKTEDGMRAGIAPHNVYAASLYDQLYAYLRPGEVRAQDSSGSYVSAKVDGENKIALLELLYGTGSPLQIFASGAGTNYVRGLAEPLVSADAANKGYVDGIADTKAPAGCGYGDTMALYNVQDGTFEASMDELLEEMPNLSARQIQFIDSADLSTLVYKGTLWKYTTNYAVLDAISYAGTKAAKVKQAGTWGAWEFQNPGNYAGVEYPTMERYSHKTVYTKLVAFGALPNAATKTVATGVSASRIIRSEIVIYTEAGYCITSPYFLADGTLLIKHLLFNTNVQITTNSDYSTATAFVRIWYTAT